MAARVYSIHILGSGGPYATKWRTSSCCVLSVGDRPRILIDAGGGAFARIGAAGIDLVGLDLIALTHTHIDHTGGLAPLLFDLTMRERAEPIAIAGPSPNVNALGIRAFLELLFGERGAWGYLHTFENFKLDVGEQPSEDGVAKAVSVGMASLDAEGATLKSLGVPHGNMAALAYRFEIGGHSVTFTGDVSDATPELVEFALGSSLLVCDMALPERAVKHGNLHIKPSAIGRLAAGARVEQLVLAHIMPELEDAVDGALAEIKKSYRGRTRVAADGFKTTF